ncbi:MAG: 4-demethylwyosine synthase TYW1 [Thermoplasmata archaeon]|nr:4-demethylwyosine synthase TYW1 [Thermoplasmata archaeon]
MRSSGAEKKLEWQGYKLVGDSAGVKGCHWLKAKLLYGKPCYKEKFYGIESHRCMQMTPTLNICNCQCLFCWRFHGMKDYPSRDTMSPSEMLDKMISAQKEIVSGFKGDERCSKEKWLESREPKHVAISLSGEPTLYPNLSELIEECNKRGMTTFLVTNGTNPKAIAALDPLPTQLYVTIAAPNADVFEKLCLPRTPRLWERFNETIEILPSLDTRKVVRLTLVKGWNMGWELEYAKIISRASPDFIEAKAYMFVGDSRNRLTIENMPGHDEIKMFSDRLSAETSYEIKDEHPDSRVVLLSNGKKSLRIREG